MLDLSKDYLVFDEGDITGQNETVTFYSSLPNSPGIACSNAQRLDTRQFEAAPSQGVYTKTDVYYDLRTQDFSDAPQVGDYVIDEDGEKFWVLEVRKPIFNDYWGLQCRCPKLYYGLTDMASWEPAVNVLNDAWLDRQLTNPTTSGVYNCRIQPLTSSQEDMLGFRGLKNHFCIYLFEELDLNEGDIFVDQNNLTYRVKLWQSKKNLASLLEIYVERIPVGSN